MVGKGGGLRARIQKNFPQGSEGQLCLAGGGGGSEAIFGNFTIHLINLTFSGGPDP